MQLPGAGAGLLTIGTRQVQCVGGDPLERPRPGRKVSQLDDFSQLAI